MNGMTPSTKEEILKQYFGYESFREGQERLIDRVLAGGDCLGVMPTGAGKSLCFQVPALMVNGVTIVISPLISLMKDQVNALTQSGVRAAYINSSLNERQIRQALINACNGVYKIIYAAPERLETPDFLDFAQRVTVSMVTIDEAHCISQWGQDFRPSYLKIPDFLENLPKRPVISAFTATATPKVREDIVNLLRLREPTVLVTGFNRPNLFFSVTEPKDKFSALLSFLRDREEKAGIVYCSTRKTVEEVCAGLKSNGYKASRYHAGLTDAERRGNQDDFLYDHARVMVATNAFGMGIDKSNVGYVVHYNMPTDVESYYQEAGRAGRDGSPAECLLLYGGMDVRTNQFLIENGKDAVYPDAETEERVKELARERLKRMTFYCRTTECLRAYLLRYFGERPANYCGGCGNCLTKFEEYDATTDALKILSCVIKSGERYGILTVIDILRGAKNEKITGRGLDRLSTYGICETSEQRLRSVINEMVLNETLRVTDDRYPVLKRGKHAAELLKPGASMVIKLAKETSPVSAKRAKPSAPVAVNQELFEKLKELRLEIARKQNVPAFVIFADSTLTDMCIKKPKNNEQMLAVSGVGNVKLEKYGEKFLKAIRSYTKSPLS